MRILGKGSFGIVRQCRSRLDGFIYAVKSIPLDRGAVDKKVTFGCEDDGPDYSKQMQEVDIMRGLKHPYIIEYRGYFTDADFGAKSFNKRRPDCE